jgi:hypothetical protein
MYLRLTHSTSSGQALPRVQEDSGDETRKIRPLICLSVTRRTVANGEARRSTPRRSFGPKFFSPVSAQEFHLRFESAHARSDAFIFFRGPGDRSIDRALTD